jgi:hypothetical protein
MGDCVERCRKNRVPIIRAAVAPKKTPQEKEQAEKARSKYPERERKTIRIGVIRIKG